MNPDLLCLWLKIKTPRIAPIGPPAHVMKRRTTSGTLHPSDSEAALSKAKTGSVAMLKTPIIKPIIFLISILYQPCRPP